MQQLSNDTSLHVNWYKLTLHHIWRRKMSLCFVFHKKDRFGLSKKYDSIPKLTHFSTPKDRWRIFSSTVKKVRKMCIRNIYDKKCYAQVEVNFHSSFFFLYIKKSKRTQEDGLNQLWKSFSFDRCKIIHSYNNLSHRVNLKMQFLFFRAFHELMH